MIPHKYKPGERVYYRDQSGEIASGVIMVMAKDKEQFNDANGNLIESVHTNNFYFLKGLPGVKFYESVLSDSPELILNDGPGNFLVKTWGGFFQRKKKLHGKKPGYYFFKTEQERQYFIDELNNIADKLEIPKPVINKVEDENSRLRTIAKVIFVYKSKEYRFDYDFGFGYHEESARYMFEDGNYSCDCNRSIFIKQYCDPEFPQLDCNDDLIQLVNFKINYEPAEKEFYPLE